jgi:RHS repeat-associated protein
MNSACLEADAAGNIISYEEFHPFGTTAYQANDKNIKAAYKRYRYLGMERDEESGLQYHTARYYLPWLGRWLSSDPIGIGDGLNVYRYSRNNPLVFSDTNGNNCGAQPEVETHRKKEKKKEEKEATEKAALDVVQKGKGEATEKPSSGGAGPGDGGDKGSSVGEKILEGIKGFGKWIGEAIGKLWDWIKGAATAIWNWLKNAVSSAWDWLKGAATSAWNWIKGAAGTAWNWIKDTAQAAWNWIKNAAKTAWEWTKQKAAEFWNWFAGDDGFLEDFFEIVVHLTWGLPGTLVGLLFTLFNFTIGNLIVAIHNSKAANAMDQWEYASLTIGGPANENDIIGNYGGILNLGGLSEAVTLGPFVFFQGSGSAARGTGAKSIQDYYVNETPMSIYLSKQNLRTADHEEGHEDQNLLYGPFTLLFGLIFSLIPNAAKSPHSSGWYWFDRQANMWSSGRNSPFKPNPNVHP